MKQAFCKLRTWVAILLIAALVAGVVGMIPHTSKEPDAGDSPVVQDGSGTIGSADSTETTDPLDELLQNIENESVEDLTREEQEQIVTLLGDSDQTVTDLENLTDEEVNALIEDLLDDLDSKTESSIEVDEEYYNEDGAMTLPFDQAYPELIEDGSVEFDDETLLIKLSNSLDGKISDGMREAGVAALEAVVPMEKATWYEAKLVEGTDAMDALAALRELKEVLLAEYNYEIKTASIDGYKDFGDGHDFDRNEHHDDQWYMHHCGIPDGMSVMKTDGGSSSVIVAVIDTGVDYDHEDLAQNIWVNSGEIPDNGCDDDGNGYVDDYYGVDIVYGSGNGDDDNGHGTHVAGIIAAQNNNLGTVGIAYNVKIMPIKAAMASGTLNQSDIARAVLYAYEMGAEVINMSFGGTACSIAVQDALSTAYTRCVLVASAGNSGAPNEGRYAIPNYPAALTYVLGVMSVDQYGIESSFTNWDTVAFNEVEYELYAPGTSIMSTLPNDKYGSLSGTSMAAPVVSAFAAILRSEYTDRDMYPTKFIYGQLSATSDYSATCINPTAHGAHNLPQIVDLHSALTKMPEPEVNLQTYDLFDTEGLYDNGSNNGDGVIDAGETIALGLTLRNRWGMSENTVVSIDTLSMAGISDPYITIHNDSVNYGSVGTYSTKNCGAIYTDELLTGWENPFYITIAEDCPNDYIFKLNVTVTCGDALNEENEKNYTTHGEIWLTVRNGVILPSIIDEDMTLTAENLYIIPNSTVITTGTVVTVEPGTNIQFWSDDPEDPYADTYVAYLLVNGVLDIQGTKEDMVYIYPSELMGDAVVEICEGPTGKVSMTYADVTNLTCNQCLHPRNEVSISYADHCTFRQSYEWIRVRSVNSDGSIHEYITQGYYPAMFGEAKDCAFYKLFYVYIRGNYDRCIFAGGRQLSVEYYESSYTDCVFLGCNTSSVTVDGVGVNDQLNVLYREDTGTTYIMGNKYDITWRYTDTADYLEALGGHYLIIETEDEAQWLGSHVSGSYDAGLTYDYVQQTYLWSDGSEVGEFMDVNGSLQTPPQTSDNFNPFVAFQTYTSSDYVDCGLYVEQNGYTYIMFEIPGEVLPTEITFANYSVILDLESTYQLNPFTAPLQLELDNFLFESSNESVVTVSETGLVTPVGEGTADVYVYYKDRAVYNYVTFTVGEYVPLESVSLSADLPYVAVGKTLSTRTVLLPADTTRQYVTYSSSDETVATVDMLGNVTGVSAGKVTITAACEDQTAQLALTVYEQAKSLSIDPMTITGTVEEPPALPEITYTDGAEVDFVWQVLDPAVAEIGENGELVGNGPGITVLTVTDRRSGLSDSVSLYLTEEALTGIKKVKDGYVLYENGDLYSIGQSAYRYAEPKLYDQQVVSFDTYQNAIMILYEDKTISKYYSYGNTETWVDFVDTEIQPEEVIVSNNQQFVITVDGEVYSWGSNNSNGQLGLGTTDWVNEPTKIPFTEKITTIYAADSATAFLTASGNLYMCGGTSVCLSTPTLVTRDVSVLSNGVVVMDGYHYVLNCSELTLNGGEAYTFGEYDLTELYYDSASGYGIRDGVLYHVMYGSEYALCDSIPNATSLYVSSYGWGIYEGCCLIGTSDGLLYYVGYDSFWGYPNSWYGDLVLVPVVQPEQETNVLLGTNLTEIDLIGGSLILHFSQELCSGYASITENGIAVSGSCSVDGGDLIVKPSLGFADGAEYTVTVVPSDIQSKTGYNLTEEIVLTFTYHEQEVVADEVVIHKSVLDTSIHRWYTTETLNAAMNKLIDEDHYNPHFNGNVILNPISTVTDTTKWMRVIARTVNTGDYLEIPLAGNYWGTVNERAVGLQIMDYADQIIFARLMHEPYLMEAPENTFPFVTSITILNAEGEAVTTVGNETITVRVTFNRDMDTTIPLQVRFGSAVPYGDYEIPGEYVDERTWEGTYTLNTLIENGNQYWNISNGCSATDDLALYADVARLGFVIDTTAAQALLMQGNATDTGIQLTWTQDDFDTLMGYNVYRSTAEDGYYTRLNNAVIPADQMEFFDDTVEPGVIYYYNFTVVQTDLTESEPSGKISIMSKDTMAPDIYHSPVTNAFTGANLVITATVTDNLNIAYANLYYRVTGETEWRAIRMNSLNSKYSAIIPAEYVTLDGIEYYIEAFDGVSYTYKASADAPYAITVQEAIDENSLGDVDGNGVINNRDALLILQAINDKVNLTAEEFARADLDGDGELHAYEALRILQYITGLVGSVVIS